VPFEFCEGQCHVGCLLLRSPVIRISLKEGNILSRSDGRMGEDGGR